MKVSLSQYFTPTWAAELIVQEFYPRLSADDTVIDPSCGDGRILMAIPEDVTAVGVEIDPLAAQAAIANTGRQIVTGDFAASPIDVKPTLILGNPPFKAGIIDQFLDRAHQLLDEGHQVGFILPCYLFQSSSRVVRYNHRWGLKQTMLPRDLFERLEKPLMFAQFIKDRQTIMAGLFLHAELNAVKQFHQDFRQIFVGNRSRASVWGEAVEHALIALGGEAPLSAIYRVIEGNRPTPNPWWKEKIRQTLQLYFRRVDQGVYGLNLEEATA